MKAPVCIVNARLPRWLLPPAWPATAGGPALAELTLADGRITGMTPMTDRAPTAPDSGRWDVMGAPVLPGLVDAHTHLDKTLTLPRMGQVQPGLLAAIDAMMTDRAGWTEADVRERAGRALGWAWQAGCVHMRSHVDWWEADSTPLAWEVLAGLSAEWRGRIHLEQVSLIKLPLFRDLAQARRLAARVAATGEHAVLGAFVHSSNWDAEALRHVFIAAAETGLDVDLHVDEELNPDARGLAATASIVRETGFGGRVVCGHTCALAAQPEKEALATLDAVAPLPITLITLPITNLLLQDAATGRTPRLRGLTLVREARERGIPVLVASDNVQDPFCRVGSYDPVEALAAGVLAAQLGDPFDEWSDSLCRSDWLRRTPLSAPSLVGAAADLVIFMDADAWGWPSRASRRVVLRSGIPLSPFSPQPERLHP
ncbi:amidohydrolase family protein [Polaromonas sp.]|jgi:cytosine deaminase|uniref:amidohydrolase family protein n=1 Tax=Polaromonas sp. TaxID=1869339 RepID=UPI0037C93FDA